MRFKRPGIDLANGEMTRSLGVCPMTWDIAEVYFITFVLARVGITIPILLFYPGLPLESIDGSAPASSRMVPMAGLVPYG